MPVWSNFRPKKSEINADFFLFKKKMTYNTVGSLCLINSVFQLEIREMSNFNFIPNSLIRVCATAIFWLYYQRSEKIIKTII